MSPRFMRILIAVSIVTIGFVTYSFGKYLDTLLGLTLTTLLVVIGGFFIAGWIDKKN